MTRKGGQLASIFLSYAREDLGRAEALATALGRAGHTVWWDRHIKGGSQYAAEIEAALGKSDAVVVLWSQHSASSPWVRDEAAAARDSAKLIPVTLDHAAPPMGFRQYQAIDMSDWRGRGRPVRLRDLIAAIDNVVGAPSSDPQPLPSQRGTRMPAVARRPVVLVFVTIFLLALTAGGWVYWQKRTAAAEPISIAVLPFDALPADATNGPFAEGVSEEVLGGLARNPRLRLTGRMSAAMFKDSTADSRTIGRKLGVIYLLDGTVRRAGNQVRVGVALVRAADGVQLWRHTYNGSLDDIFAIQARIGQAVEGQLRATFVGKEGVTASSLATSGEAYRYYLTARSLIRDREPAKLDPAITLLRKALAIDPNYAPAWANLAVAVTLTRNMSVETPTEEDSARVTRQSIEYADRALMLAPQLAEAHIAKTFALSGSESTRAEARRELKIAARLDPNNAEIWHALAQGLAADGDYIGELNVWRRAVAIDPLWWRAFAAAKQSAWELGYEEEALGYLRRPARENGPFQAHMTRADIAFGYGDWSLGLKEGLAAKAVATSGERFMSEFMIGSALRGADYLEQARQFWRMDEVDETLWNLWHGEPPSKAEIARRLQNPLGGWNEDNLMRLLLKSLVNTGRSDEVVALYRQRFGSVDKLLNSPLDHAALVENGTAIAIALRAVGREGEASELLARIRREVDARLRKSRVPRAYPFLAAQVAAAQGYMARALSLLEKSDSNRWWYAQQGNLRDIADEPAFRILKGNPRFEAIARRQRAWQAKERREMAPMLAHLGTP